MEHALQIQSHESPPVKLINRDQITLYATNIVTPTK